MGRRSLKGSGLFARQKATSGCRVLDGVWLVMLSLVAMLVLRSLVNVLLSCSKKVVNISNRSACFRDPIISP